MVSKKGLSKSGLSPVIATVLIIVVVLVLASIIFLWASRFLGDRCMKFGGPCSDKCSDVQIVASYSNGQLTIENQAGQIGVYGVKIKTVDGGNRDVSNTIKLLDEGLAPGRSATISVSGTPNKIIPVLEGVSEKTGDTKYYDCSKNEVDVR